MKKIKINMIILRSVFFFLLFFTFIFYSLSAYGAVIRYVDASAPPGGDGTSWADAYRDIQSAINDVSSMWIICMGPTYEIWVKEGTYSLSSQINVNKYVAIYGGFDGTETSVSQRDWQNNTTTIYGNNSVRCLNITAPAIIDGFTIKRGNASGSGGGGIYIDCTPVECTMLGFYHTPKIRNCYLTLNYTNIRGGAIYDLRSDPSIINCTFYRNYAISTGGDGGAIFNWESSPNIEKCIFSENQADDLGGAILSDYLCYGSITNCIFKNNSAGSGGAIYYHMAYQYITNSTFTQNEATSSGGAICSNTGGPRVKNCIFWDDSPDEIIDYYTSSTWPYVIYSDVDGGYTGTGNIDADPEFVSSSNLMLTLGSPCIDTGTNSGAPDEDIVNTPRPQDGNGDAVAVCDMGAYEYPESMLPSITVTYPNGGENWPTGVLKTILWTSQNIIGYVKIEISRNSGSTWSTITNSTSNDGAYDWTVTAPESTNCRIRVTSASNNIYTDMSDADFTIIGDTTPPEPNPMTWSAVPYEVSISEIRMSATAASDPTPTIQYYFDFYSSPTGGAGGDDSNWQTNRDYADTGLSANHQYGYRVKARDGNNNQTGYSGISYNYTGIETPSGITFGTVTSGCIMARSSNTPSNLSSGSSGLIIYNDTKGTDSGWKKNNDYWNSCSLSPNTRYRFSARARNGDGDKTPLSPVAYKYTLANVPGPAAFSNITQTSIRANWTANGNPKGTEYFCENITRGTNSGWITDTLWTSTGLKPATTYSFRVRARNAEGVQTGWKNLGSAITLPSVINPCEADFDGDGDVDGRDLAVFAADFGRTNCNVKPPCEADFDGDGDVDGRDLAVFAADFGRTDCP